MSWPRCSVVGEGLPHEADVLALFGRCEDYFVAATGFPAAAGDVQSLFYSLPPGVDLEMKRLLVIRDGNTVVGLVDVIDNYPDVDSCSVGIFLIEPGSRRQGLGRHMALRLAEELRRLGRKRVTATCPRDWAPGIAFLEHLGFQIDAPERPGPEIGNRLRKSVEYHLCSATLDLAS
ncbi:Acetyltransferase (GNAT) family protein [Austwickia chelonae]|uniref:N-acetyltransferase domain-containing protein n=1 Tax=Austwickia chelonae NBRC 105200 TaxID=1184607 RepID=K6V8D2_9MICO|nr:GNAT family N-acetyltransferase [Austwickia chelonae]GAB78478.1 hypothetical protein AUCHE_09_00830 [Austwickia chelonae NBRC 105200]SEW39965.1 Acetyltransferase (GNAT) family protein [Austwickia chelonae]